MIKVGDVAYEWVLLHIRNGEELAGMVEVPTDLHNESNLYKRCLAAEVMQPKIMVANGGDNSVVDRIVELRNPHRVVTQFGDGKQIMAVMPLNLGDKIIVLRASEILYPQFLDDKSPVVIEIRKSSAGLVSPGEEGETRSGGGIIIPGAKP